MQYLEMHIRDARHVQHPFGIVYELVRNKRFNVARAIITGDRMHYHKNATEIYYVMSGRGTMEVGCKVVELRPHTAVLIEARTRHRARAASRSALDIIVFSSLPYNPKDEFYD